METFCLIFGILLLVVAAFLVFGIIMYEKEIGDGCITTSSILGATATVCIIAGVTIIDRYCSPDITPIDVYRGKTTLEITYRDSIAIDSTVVWKE